jgi:hypothetical protein
MNCRGFGWKRSWTYLRYYPGLCLEGLRKTMKNFNECRRSPGRDFNPEPPEYRAGVLATQSLRSVPMRATCLVHVTFLNLVALNEGHVLTVILTGVYFTEGNTYKEETERDASWDGEARLNWSHSLVVSEYITEVKLHTALVTLWQVPESNYVCLRR